MSENHDLTLDQPDLTPDGLKKSLHGSNYQLSLIFLSIMRLLKEKKKFTLHSEAREHEKFDDLVIDNGETMIFVQAKHTYTNISYSLKNFCSDEKQDCSLAKYFDSWYLLKKSKYSKTESNNEKQCFFYFVTNRNIEKKEEFLEDCSDSFLDEKIFKSFKFKTDENTRKFLIDAIKNFSDVNKNYTIQKNQSDYIIDEKKVKKRSSNTMFTNKYFKVDITTDEYLIRLANQFLSDFTIKIENSNNNTELTTIISDLIKSEFEIAHNEAFNSCFCYLHSWFTNPETTSLKSKDFLNFIKDLKANQERFYFLSETYSFIKECQSDNSFESKIFEQLKAFINDSDESLIAITNRFGAIKQHVHYAIKKLNYIEGDWFYFKFSLQNFLNEKISIVLKGSTKFAILDLCEIENLEMKEMDRLISIKNTAVKNKKKILRPTSKDPKKT